MTEQELGLEGIQREWLKKAKLVLILAGKRYRLCDRGCELHSDVNDDPKEKAQLVNNLMETEKSLEEHCLKMLEFEKVNSIGATQIIPEEACRKNLSLFICTVLLCLSRCNEQLYRQVRYVAEALDLSCGRTPAAFFLRNEFRGDNGLLVPHLHFKDTEELVLDRQGIIFKDVAFCKMMRQTPTPQEQSRAVLGESAAPRRRF
jgi:hypothetical protein